jgi:hypothetical protein
VVLAVAAAGRTSVDAEHAYVHPVIGSTPEILMTWAKVPAAMCWLYELQTAGSLQFIQRAHSVTHEGRPSNMFLNYTVSLQSSPVFQEDTYC